MSKIQQGFKIYEGRKAWNTVTGPKAYFLKLKVPYFHKNH